MFKIYVVEDEVNLANLLIKYLNNEGYEATLFSNGEDAYNHINDECHLWILDIMLPGGLNGYDLIKDIRKNKPNMPVIFTSARDQDIDKIMGLELGSDDYVSKPYSIRELMLRVKNLINRTYQMDSLVQSNIIKYNKYVVDSDKRSVYENDELLNLTSKEYDLLILLLENKGKAFSRDQILEHIWGNDYFGSDRVVDDLMRRLRQKMDALDVETMYGFGYRLK
ncbi:MAG: response regulator transcription factor [Anaeroplasmataceae bacterium]